MIHLIIAKGLAFYQCPYFFYNTYNPPPCLADQCHILTSEVPICLMTGFVCFCLWSLYVSIQHCVYLYVTVFCTTAI